MTFKKSMISIAAAGVIAASLTGCGSSSSSGGGNPTATTLTAVDGYVNNANAAAILVSGAPVSLSFVEDSHTYSLPSDLNLSNYAGLELTFKAATVDAASTYFDNDGVAGYSAAGGDIQAGAGFKMYAPKGFSVVTPLSTLVYSLVDTSETNATALEADVTAKLASVAASLNISTTELQSTDPLASTNGAYALANALAAKTVEGNTLAALKTVVTNLLARPTPNSAAEVFANLAIVDAGNAAMYTSTSNALIADPTILDRVKTMNLDKVREVAATGTFTELSNTVVASDFNVTSISVGGYNVKGFSAPGSKVNPADLNNTAIVISAKDNNNSADANLDLIIHYGNEASNVASTVADSQITVKINLDLNTTAINGTDLNGTVSNTVQIDYVKGDGTSVTLKDQNSTALDLNITDLVTINDGNITVQTAAILERIDANLTVGINGLDSVASLQMALVDNNSSLATVVEVAGKTYPTAKNTTFVKSYYGAIKGTGLTIFDLGSKTATEKKLADLRSTSSTYNSKPNHTLELTDAISTVGFGHGNSTHPYILTANADTNYTMTLNAGTTDTFENNSTVGFAISNTVLDGYADDANITTGLKAGAATTVATGNILVPTALNDINTSGAITGTITSVVTDEFLLKGDANNTLYVTLNRSPYEVNTTALTINIEKNATDSIVTDSNTTAMVSIMDRDGNDFNGTTAAISFVDVNNSTLDANTTDINVSLVNNTIVMIEAATHAWEVNASLVYVSDNKYVVNIDTNASDTNLSEALADTNATGFDGITFTLSDYNLTDKYGSVRTISGDKNITINFQD